MFRTAGHGYPPRTAHGRGRLSAPPPLLGFSWITEKRRRVAPLNFAYLFTQHFDTFPDNFDLITSKITPPGPDLKLRFSKFETLSKTHQSSKLSETLSVQYGHRCLRFVYLGFFISVTSGHVNFMTFSL